MRPRSIPVLSAFAAAVGLAGSALAQVNPVVGYPNNYLSVSVGWANELLLNQSYGAGWPNASSFGTTSVTYDTAPGPTFGTLQSSNITMSQFAASADPSGPANVTNAGLLQFTPVVNCQYVFSGVINYAFVRSFAAAGASCTMTLEEIGGPVLTNYSTTLVGIPNSIGNGGVLFDAAAPALGPQTGMLAAGTAYRWTWSINTFLTAGSDPGARTSLNGSNNGFGLSFSVPAPSAAALLGVGGLMAMGGRRRRGTPGNW
jgi:hypothetical protein